MTSDLLRDILSLYYGAGNGNGNSAGSTRQSVQQQGSTEPDFLNRLLREATAARASTYVSQPPIKTVEPRKKLYRVHIARQMYDKKYPQYFGYETVVMDEKTFNETVKNNINSFGDINTLKTIPQKFLDRIDENAVEYVDQYMIKIPELGSVIHSDKDTFKKFIVDRNINAVGDYANKGLSIYSTKYFDKEASDYAVDANIKLSDEPIEKSSIGYLKGVKVSKQFLKDIDEAAKATGVNRSAIMAMLLLEDPAFNKTNYFNIHDYAWANIKLRGSNYEKGRQRGKWKQDNPDTKADESIETMPEYVIRTDFGNKIDLSNYDDVVKLHEKISSYFVPVARTLPEAMALMFLHKGGKDYQVMNPGLVKGAIIDGKVVLDDYRDKIKDGIEYIERSGIWKIIDEEKAINK